MNATKSVKEESLEKKVREILAKALPDDVRRRTIILSVAMEGILGHMATLPIHSVEAGLIRNDTSNLHE